MLPELTSGCQPPWEPSDRRFVTWDGKDLTGETVATQRLFYKVWGTENAMQRWRWEYECQHPGA